ncbi:2Fe-2S iron-sulfur cluster-binding protein [Burkholderia pyrrocinia]|uniref:2Fe-2S iron-sulfur cluster-binding protein n=1 Tax=Burkholderia pyrrocinia TaxID=60550 RepID=UPI002AB01621|nr:2Fe-2S iron-sulfur cluster-binding protein [Burkholderia pyrrocinia]
MPRVERGAPGINASRKISFTFDGVAYDGFEGDTLASALLANKIFVHGRSFKLHRPRGVIAAGADEPNAIVQLEPGTSRSEPDLKATQIELYDGLVASSVNCWPNAQFDLGAFMGVLKPFVPAGFYYKTLMWPSWHIFEPAIRKAAGLGVAPTGEDPDQYDRRYAHCDVLIVGAGPSGLVAADALSATGASLMIVDENPVVGASFMWAALQADGRRGLDWALKIAHSLALRGNVRVMRRTTATGYYDGNTVTLIERVSEHIPIGARGQRPRQRMWIVRAKHVIIATGAHERPIVFGNNDRPGIMLANAAATYASYYGVRLGNSALAFINNNLAYKAIFSAHDSGTSVHNIVDSRVEVDGNLVRECQRRGIALHTATVVCNTSGYKRIKSAEIRSADGERRVIPCDLLLMSGGWSPVVHLYSQNHGKLAYDSRLSMFRPDATSNDVRCVTIGAANGTLSVGAAIDEAIAAAERLNQALGGGAAHRANIIAPAQFEDGDYHVSPLWSVDGNAAPAWVDFQNDVTAADIRLAARENFVSVEHLKRYTTTGMASDQGKTSNVNALALLGAATHRAPDEVGTTKFRPPYSPVTIGAFAGHARGDIFRPRRRLSAEDVHRRFGAHMLEYGAWTRPAFYRIRDETDESAWNREVVNVRETVGIFDGSPLGKIEVKGPDAVEFLNAVYANELGTLLVGRCRYSVILNEGGGILDDGVIARIAEDHYLVGASSAGAQRVTEALEFWRESCGYRVSIMQVSDQWATYAITGPDARRIMQLLPLDIDVGKDAFPHMSFRNGSLDGVPCRIARVSFSGELTFELSVPARYGSSVFESVIELGALPFGVEALMIMRVEKGYIHVGVDTEPSTTLNDVGMGAYGSKKARPFVGQRAAARSHLAGRTRAQLVGIECENPDERLRTGAHLLCSQGGRSEGHLTSCVWSPILKKYISLALLRAGFSRIGEQIKVYDDGKYTDARVVKPCFFDPEGKKLAL